MALLRSAARLASPVVARRTPTVNFALKNLTVRGLSVSAVRNGHNLEDHYDMAEFVVKMHTPIGEYFVWALMFSMFIVTMGPFAHSNYYFTGRFFPKVQGNTQLCDDSW